jgi:hypothetical protein
MAGFWGQSFVNDWEAFEPSGFGRDYVVIVCRSHGVKFYCKFPATNQFSQICPVLFSNDDGESILQ